MGNLWWFKLSKFRRLFKSERSAHSVFDGYDAEFKQDESLGWLAGIRLSTPEYYFRTFLTLSFSIEHEITNTTEAHLKSCTEDTCNVMEVKNTTICKLISWQTSDRIILYWTTFHGKLARLLSFKPPNLSCDRRCYDIFLPWSHRSNPIQQVMKINGLQTRLSTRIRTKKWLSTYEPLGDLGWRPGIYP